MIDCGVTRAGLITETRERIKELELAIADEKDRFIDKLWCLSSTLDIGDASGVLFDAYYDGEGIVPVKVIHEIADCVGIDWSNVTRGTITVRCQFCGRERETKITSRTGYKDLIRPRNRHECDDCKDRRNTESSQRYQEYNNQRLSRLRELRSMPYAEYLQSDEWKETRKSALKRARYRCELCYRGGELHTHHKTYERLGEEYAKDLIVLCKECHAKFHDKLPKEREQ